MQFRLYPPDANTGFNIMVSAVMCKAGRSDTLAQSEGDLGVGVKCRKSGVKSVANRGVGSPVLNCDTLTSRFCLRNEDVILYLKWKCHLHMTVCFPFLGSLFGISNCSAALCMN